jgi:hypothetical protein
VDFGSGVLTSVGSADTFVASYSATGAAQWSKRWGDTGYDYGYGIGVDGAGNVVVTGSFQGTADFGGGPVASLGQFFGADIVLAKYTGAGQYVWAKTFGSGFGEASAGLGVDTTGNISLTGPILGALNFGTGFLFGSGDYDVFVAKFAPNGTNQWSKRRGGSSDDKGRGTAIDTGGNVIVTGNFPSSIDFGGGLMTTNGNSDVFVAKFKP